MDGDLVFAHRWNSYQSPSVSTIPWMTSSGSSTDQVEVGVVRHHATSSGCWRRYASACRLILATSLAWYASTARR